ncbi:hypothetical protein SARC_09827 [Sphaeroforma arctica JP610]|uniref:Uncharacterized protein n=1 Tax=Sphaeroforma arctica JP610 TaxID=667725 RepID=A0A0L0FLT8_9EUKA|nr:hypothetical protein SARC_09827 [Sphaeroforma arctica JP610]KNC77720.1 hypothetical protein SARC_09827 [Sphaeroforma arctica JP610]|eukprot:XP_014151622.1 hypothetical protein SARC_09827 [Sphaeroforma arctica JP610]
MQSNVANTLVCSEYCRIESTGTPVLSTNGANDDISTSYTSFTEEPTTDSSIPVANTSINDNEGYTQARSYVQRQQSLIVDYHPHTIKHSLNRGSSAPLRPARPLNPVLSQISMDSLTRDVLDISDVSMISANSNLTRRTTDTVDKKIAPSSSHRLLHPRRHSVPGPKVLEAIADDPLSQKNRDSVRMKKKALKIIRFVRTLSRRGSDRV